MMTLTVPSLKPTAMYFSVYETSMQRPLTESAKSPVIGSIVASFDIPVSEFSIKNKTK